MGVVPLVGFGVTPLVGVAVVLIAVPALSIVVDVDDTVALLAAGPPEPHPLMSTTTPIIVIIDAIAPTQRPLLLPETSFPFLPFDPLNTGHLFINASILTRFI